MKKRLLIICSLISVLLAGFQFPIYAEETTPDYSSSTSIITSAALDQYFYDNYELLPYLESDGSQYINTNIDGNNNLRLSLSASRIYNTDSAGYYFGSASNGKYFGLLVVNPSTDYRMAFNINAFNFSFIPDDYQIYNFLVDKNEFYMNGSLLHEFDNSEFSSGNIYLFAYNNNPTATLYGNYKLYNCSIYDYSANEGEGALVRDYYPARSKSGGVIGLYDAVNKTFVTTSGSVPFASPTGDPVNLSLGANVTQFLSGSLFWIGAIFEGINDMPIIWVFMAIGLAGAMFRWARRLVHF